MYTMYRNAKNDPVVFCHFECLNAPHDQFGDLARITNNNFEIQIPKSYYRFGIGRWGYAEIRGEKSVEILLNRGELTLVVKQGKEYDGPDFDAEILKLRIFCGRDLGIKEMSPV